MLFFISSTFISNARLKLVKYQANTNKHTEAELCYLKIIHILHQGYNQKIIGHILKISKRTSVSMRLYD